MDKNSVEKKSVESIEDWIQVGDILIEHEYSRYIVLGVDISIKSGPYQEELILTISVIGSSQLQSGKDTLLSAQDKVFKTPYFSFGITSPRYTREDIAKMLRAEGVQIVRPQYYSVF